MSNSVQPFNARTAVFTTANQAITRYKATPQNLEVLDIREDNHVNYNTVLTVQIDLYPDIPEDELLPRGAIRYSKRTLPYNRMHIARALDRELTMIAGNHQLIHANFSVVNETTVAAFLTTQGIALSANEIRLKKSSADKWLVQTNQSLNYYGAVTVKILTAAPSTGGGSQTPTGHSLLTDPVNTHLAIRLDSEGGMVSLLGYTTPNTRIIAEFEGETIFDVVTDQYGDVDETVSNEYLDVADAVAVRQSQSSSGKTLAASPIVVTVSPQD